MTYPPSRPDPHPAARGHRGVPPPAAGAGAANGGWCPEAGGQDWPWGAGGPPEPGEEDGHDEDLLRPFVVTGGRSRPRLAGLRVETQVRARPETTSRPLRFEAQRIVAVCHAPRSVAEVAVLLGMPLSVVRILIADLVAEQVLVCEEPGRISIALLERIRERVLAL